MFLTEFDKIIPTLLFGTMSSCEACDWFGDFADSKHRGGIPANACPNLVCPGVTVTKPDRTDVTIHPLRPVIFTAQDYADVDMRRGTHCICDACGWKGYLADCVSRGPLAANACPCVDCKGVKMVMRDGTVQRQHPVRELSIEDLKPR